MEFKLLQAAVLTLPLLFAQGLSPDINVEQLEDGTATIVIRNITTADISAYALTFSQKIERAGGPRVVWTRSYHDSAVRVSNRPITAGKDRSIKIGVKGTAGPAGQIRAGLFDDGTSFGDPAWVGLLREARLASLDASLGALEQLHAATATSPSLENSISTIESDYSKRLEPLSEGIKRAQAEVTKLGDDLTPFDGATPTARAANMALLAAKDREAAVRSVYTTLLQNLKVPPTSKGEPLDEQATISVLKAKLNQDVARLRVATTGR